MPEAILIQNSDSANVSVVSATDTPVTSVNIKPTTYDNIQFQTTMQVATDASSSTQNVTIKLKFLPNNSATPVTLTTWNYKTDAAIRTINQHLVYIGNIYQTFCFTVGGTLSLTINGAATDTHTIFTALNIYITSIE